MKIKLHGNDIVCTDISPNIKIAEFNDECTSTAKKYLVLMANFGQDFMDIYQSHRLDMHISNVHEMLQKMEKLYSEYHYERTKIRRKNE
jgi:hypothetical protein